MKEKLLTLEKFDRAKAWIEVALQDLQRTLAEHDVHVYRELTGTAAVTATPYTHAKWDVVDESVTEYRDGMIVCIKVPVAGNGTYGTGLQINNLGYKPVVYNVNSMVSTRYSVGSVVWAVYNATQTASLYVNSASASTITGCWQVQDYDANTNTIGYQLRTNSSTRPVSSTTYRYRLLFSSLDNSKWVPATNSTSTNATAARTVNQEVINPWGRIVYYSTTTARTAGQTISATTQWDRYILNLGYSFNDGSALALTFPGPVYIKCTPQGTGGAIIDSTTPYVQTLPSAADGKIYIYLGQAYSASEVELIDYHPVLYHDGTKIAVWTGAAEESDLFDCVMTSETVEGETVWSCDHTWAEIYAAHQAGKLVRLMNSSDSSVFMPVSISSNSGTFSAAMSAAIIGMKVEAISTFVYDGNHTDFSADWTWFNEAHPMFSFNEQSKLKNIEAGAQVNVQSDWNQSDNTADDYIKNKPTIPDTVSGQNDGTNWTSLTIGSTTKAIPQGGSSLPSQAGNSGKFLTTDGTDASWGDVPTEVFLCTFTTTIDYENNNEVTFSCDKTPAEIYAAYEAGKCVIMKTAGSDSDELSVPESRAVYYLESALKYDTEPVRYQLFFKCDISQFGTIFKVVASQHGFPFSLIPQNIIYYISGFSDMYGIADGWYFEREIFQFTRLQSGSAGGHLVITGAGSSIIEESDISSSDVSTAITNSHTHTNKTYLDKIPSSNGTNGQVLTSDGSSWSWQTPSSGLTEHDFAHTANTTISDSTATVTFAANQRGSAMLTISADLGLTIACNNASDNYIWIKNTGSAEVDVTISAVTKNSTAVSNVYVPSDGITVPAGGVCEIGVIVNSDGAFITSRNDLAL